MVMTSLKGMPEVRLGNIFSPAGRDHLRALGQGLVRRLHRPELRRAVARVLEFGHHHRAFGDPVDRRSHRVNGYALINWKFKGSDIFFTILIFGSFIPYQIMLYPIVILLREMGIYGTLWGLVIVHTIFGMPILTLLFRNYFSSIPEELFKAARVDGAGFWGIYFRIMLPMSPADLRGGADPASHRDLERFPVRRGLHQARHLPDDGAVEQHRQLGPGGEGIQRQHGRHRADRALCRWSSTSSLANSSSAVSPPVP